MSCASVMEKFFLFFLMHLHVGKRDGRSRATSSLTSKHCVSLDGGGDSEERERGERKM